MKANTAVSALGIALAVLLALPAFGRRGLTASRVACVLVLTLTGIAAISHVTGWQLGPNTWLAADAESTKPGLMSFQTALSFSLLAVTVILAGGGQVGGNAAADWTVAALLTLGLVIASGYIYGATSLYGQSNDTLMSPHTFGCFLLLSSRLAAGRLRAGSFSLLKDATIGSRIARVSIPVALILPYALVSLALISVEATLLSLREGAAAVAGLASFALFLAIVIVARRIDHLSRQLRDLALRDELTGVNNRRGFDLLAEQSLREANRSDFPLTILFFDIDNLKQVNDQLGHDAGSALLNDFANLLKTTFRDSDIIGRLGGDEFAVVAREVPEDADAPLARLEEATAVFLHELLTVADADMYRQKSEKKRRPRLRDEAA